ncbi:protein-arginine deiminase family protein [Nonomuraea sp. NPDC048826]|uniref:protein-arginine deiminase family protein n=1 Tax=Nonomuraea sp. NPDC048826 TaxID=3364347 RepID=UPI003719C932
MSFGANGVPLIVLANLDVDGPVPSSAARGDYLDALDDVIDGAGDRDDLTELTVPGSWFPGPPGDPLVLRLRPQDHRRVRFFGARNGGGWVRVMGAAADPAADSGEHPLVRGPGGDGDLLVEAVTLPGAPGFPADEVLLEVLRHGPDGGLSANGATLPIRIAPFLMMSNLRPAERVYVTYSVAATFETTPFIQDLAEAIRSVYGPAAAPLDPDDPVVTPGPVGMLLVLDGDEYVDFWPQDAFELGYSVGPRGWMRVAVSSPEGGKLTGWLKRTFPEPGAGLFADLLPTDAKESADKGGNLELSPPVGAGTPALPRGAAGPAVPAQGPAPFGKIIVGEGDLPAFELPECLAMDLDAGGSARVRQAFAQAGFPLRPSVVFSPLAPGPGWRIHDQTSKGPRVFHVLPGTGRLHVRYVRGLRPDHRRFLVAQGAQDLLPLDTSWLTVGHVDEIVSVIPGDPSGSGSQVLVASPAVALELLREAVHLHETEGAGLTAMFRGRLWRKPGQSALSPATMTARQVLSSFERTNEELNNRLLAVEQRLCDGLRLGTEDVVQAPVLFHRLDTGVPHQLGMITGDDVQRRTTALIPNLANVLVLGRTVVAPRPEGPRMAVADVARVLDALDVPPLAPDRLAGLRGHWYWAGAFTRAADLAGTFGVTADQILGAPENQRPGLFDANGMTVEDWARVWIPEDDVDLFEAYLLGVLSPLCLRVRFADAWTYHLIAGGVHCATNVQRVPAEADPAYPGPYWWESTP